MRKRWLLVMIFFVSSFLGACKKNSVTEQYTPIVNPVIPDFTTQVNASVNGFITDADGNALEGARIKGGAVTVTTDKYGYFKINSAAFAKSAGFVQVTKAGYFTGYRTFLPIEGKETFIRLQLITKTNTGTIDAGVGGTITTTAGAKITLPPNAVVVASGNTAYTGAVNIAAHWLNPAEEATTQLTMPGNLTGVDSAGHLNILVTYGMLAIELTGNTGELLQIAPGKKAALVFPVPASISGTAPASIPLWYFDETRAVWKQEGRAAKNGSNYEGEVTHFSFWNCDVGLPLVNFKAQVTDNDLSPLSNVPVSVSITGQVNSERIAYTDTSGTVTGLVPANSDLAIDIIAPCNQHVGFRSIQTTNSDVDLGSIKVNLQQYAATLAGTVKKCNGNPVTDGYVIATGFGSNTIMPVHNGSFSASGIICTGTNAAVIAFDTEASQQSDVRNITLVTGTNTIATLQACNTAATEIITVESSIGGTTAYTLPQYLFGGNFYFFSDSTVINAVDLLNSNELKIQFSFSGPAAPGTYPLANNNRVTIGSPGNDFIFLPGTNVTVTSYGLIGQFITGTISGNANPVPPGGPMRSYNISFNVKRDQ